MKGILYLVTTGCLCLALAVTSCNTSGQEGAAGSEAVTESETAAAEPWMQQTTFAEIPAPLKEQVTAAVQRYLALKDALVAGQPDKAGLNARQMAELLQQPAPDNLPAEAAAFYQEHAPAAAREAQAIAATQDMEEQRSQLNSLSTHVYSLAKGFGISSQPLYQQHCPMARNNEGGYWLSSSEEVRNPYFGDKMLKCGETKRKL